MSAAPMPVNHEAERSILGAILLDSKAYDEAAANGITSDDFSLDSHRKIFRNLAELAEAASAIDLITVVNSLKSHKELASVGDAGYVSSLLDGVPDRPSIKHYVRIVKEKAAQRKLIHACNSTVGGISEEMSSSEAMGYLTDQMLQIQTGSDEAAAKRVITFSEQAYGAWIKLTETASDLIGLPTGVPSLDLATTGIRDGEVWLYGGRTGDGKTCLALQGAAENCRADIPVAVFSLEMSKEALLHRLWANEGNVAFQAIRYPRGLSPETRSRIERGMVSVAKWPLFVVEDSSLSIPQLLAKARLLIRQEKVRLLIVDYLQLVSAPARDERERLTKVSRAITALAKDTGVPVVAVSQLSRPKEGNQNIRPRRFHLKESGSLENDAHTIVLIYRPVDEFGKPTGQDELIVDKQRSGMVASEQVFFDPKTLKFYERETHASH